MNDSQPDWRFCAKCSAMYFDGFEGKGSCPSDGHQHNAQGLNFRLPHGGPETANAQRGWKFCRKCFVMHWSLAGVQVCNLGGAHDATDSFDFALPHSTPETADAQTGWRFCEKCSNMHWGPAAVQACSAGGTHQARGLVFTLPHSGGSAGIRLNLWADSLRCHSETPGIGIGESDEPFVLVAVINLEQRNAVGIPPTEVFLYGALGGVDDQENHTFPFRPFWHGPFRPESAIILTALLEHDNVSPDLTRTAVAAAVQGVAVATAGADRARVVRESLSAMAGAAEPASAPGVVNRLVGPPAEVFFTPEDLAAASNGGEGRRVLRFSSFGDYSVHYLARRA